MTEVTLGGAGDAHRGKLRARLRRQGVLAGLEARRGAASMAPGSLPDRYDEASGWLKLSIHSWLLRVGGKTILIDLRRQPQVPQAPSQMGHDGDALSRAAEGGRRDAGPDRHGDVHPPACRSRRLEHAGSRTAAGADLQEREIRLEPEDFDFYKEIDADPQKGPANGGSFRDSVLPVVEAGKAQMVKGAAELEEGPGPRPRPVTRRARSASSSNRGEKALFCGDILHHAVQVYHPEWNSFACLEARGAQEPARGDRALRGIGCAPDALPFRRAVPLPYRPQGRGLRAALHANY